MDFQQGNQGNAEVDNCLEKNGRRWEIMGENGTMISAGVRLKALEMHTFDFLDGGEKIMDGVGETERKQD